MYDPWSSLVSLHKRLTPHAQVLASIPNVRNLWVLSELAAGRFRYEKSGILDVTHVRFFTRETIVQMFMETGYRIEAIVPNIDARLEGMLESLKDPKPQDVGVGKLLLKECSREDRLDLAAIQFFLRATPAK